MQIYYFITKIYLTLVYLPIISFNVQMFLSYLTKNLTRRTRVHIQFLFKIEKEVKYFLLFAEVILEANQMSFATLIDFLGFYPYNKIKIIKIKNRYVLIISMNFAVDTTSYMTEYTYENNTIYQIQYY